MEIQEISIGMSLDGVDCTLSIYLLLDFASMYDNQSLSEQQYAIFYYILNTDTAYIHQNLNNCPWKQRKHKRTKIRDSGLLSRFVCKNLVCEAVYNPLHPMFLARD